MLDYLLCYVTLQNGKCSAQCASNLACDPLQASML